MPTQFAPTQKDAYKIGHIFQYPKGTESIYSNFTARSGKLSNVPDSKGVYFVGLQYFIKDYLIKEWNESFFNQPKAIVCKKYQRRVSKWMRCNIDISHIEALYDLGYLPIEIKALPEGSFVKYGVPISTFKETLPEFFWLGNMLESVYSNEMWLPITTATTYKAFERNSLKYSELTCDDNSFVPYQNHDFSFRGMQGRFAGGSSGFAFIVAGSKGSDTLSAGDIAEDYYGATDDDEIAYSVNATEHSVMCAGGDDDEIGTFKRLLSEIYPTGMVSVVSDSWDFWKVISEYLPQLKDIIMNRDGKLICRPDSGDPIDILCGTANVFKFESHDEAENYFKYNVNGSVLYSVNDELFKVIRHSDTDFKFESYSLQPEEKGLIECLWDTFSGTLNSKGYKVLDSHIGAIYGDSITLERQVTILCKLKDKGFASSNVVFGVGSYTLGYVTRDTHGMAMKSTYTVINGEGKVLQKDPKTDSGTKKSAKGLLMVSCTNGEYRLVENVDVKQEKYGCLETVFKDGKLVKEVTFAEVRERISLL